MSRAGLLPGFLVTRSGLAWCLDSVLDTMLCISTLWGWSLTKSKATPLLQDLVRYAQLDIGVLLVNINSPRTSALDKTTEDAKSWIPGDVHHQRLHLWGQLSLGNSTDKLSERKVTGNTRELKMLCPGHRLVTGWHEGRAASPISPKVTGRRAVQAPGSTVNSVKVSGRTTRGDYIPARLETNAQRMPRRQG